MNDLVFAAQVRAARGLLDWSQQDLAMAASLSRAVVARVERGGTDARSSTVRLIREAFATAGIEMFDGPDGKIGVRCSLTILNRMRDRGA